MTRRDVIPFLAIPPLAYLVAAHAGTWGVGITLAVVAGCGVVFAAFWTLVTLPRAGYRREQRER